MSKKMVLRTTVHLSDDGVLSLCGEEAKDMMRPGEVDKIRNVRHDKVACYRCLLLHLERWEKLVADYDEALKWEERFSVFSDEDADNLVACLALVQNNPGLVVEALMADKPDAPPPVKKAAPAKKAATKQPPRKP